MKEYKKIQLYSLSHRLFYLIYNELKYMELLKRHQEIFSPFALSRNTLSFAFPHNLKYCCNDNVNNIKYWKTSCTW